MALNDTFKQPGQDLHPSPQAWSRDCASFGSWPAGWTEDTVHSQLGQTSEGLVARGQAM